MAALTQDLEGPILQIGTDLATKMPRPRAVSTACSASQPCVWLRECGLPNFSVKYGSIACTTRGSQRVVAWLSR